MSEEDGGWTLLKQAGREVMFRGWQGGGLFWGPFGGPGGLSVGYGGGPLKKP